MTKTNRNWILLGLLIFTMVFWAFVSEAQPVFSNARHLSASGNPNTVGATCAATGISKDRYVNTDDAMEWYCSAVDTWLMFPGGAGITSAAVETLIESETKIHRMCDWDNDGTTYVTCTAKDFVGAVETPWCKYSGEVIWPDFADDLNAAVHQTDSNAACETVATGDTILLDNAIYPIAPCQNSTSGAGVDYSNPFDRSQVATFPVDAAIEAECAVDKQGNLLHGLQFQDWQGVIQGAGWDLRSSTQTEIDLRAEGRTVGSTIVIDEGPVIGDWFGTTEHHKPFGFGFQDAPCGSGQYNSCHTGTGTYDLGLGVTPSLVAKDLTQIETTGTGEGFMLCISGAYADQLVAGDLLGVGAAYDATPLQQGSALTTLTFKEAITPTASDACDLVAGTNKWIRFGAHPLGIGANNPGVSRMHVTQPQGEIIGLTSFGVVQIPAGRLNGKMVLRDLTVEPQDIWNGGGDCVVATGLADYDFYFDGDDTLSADEAGKPRGLDVDAPDCDTTTMISMHEGSETHMQRVAVKHWGHFAMDGIGAGQRGVFEDVQMMYGNGQSIDDGGQKGEYVRVTISKSVFVGSIFAAYGPRRVTGMRIIDSGFSTIFTLNPDNNFSELLDTEIISSSFVTAVIVNEGAQFNTVRNLTSRGRTASWNASSPSSSMIMIEAGNGFEHITGNTFSGIRDAPPMGTWAWDSVDKTGRQGLVKVNLYGTEEGVDLIYGNTFNDMYMDVYGASKADARMVCMIKGLDETGRRLEFFTNNTFSDLEILGGGKIFGGTVGSNDACSVGDVSTVLPTGCNLFEWPGGIRTHAKSQCGRMKARWVGRYNDSAAITVDGTWQQMTTGSELSNYGGARDFSFATPKLTFNRNMVATARLRCATKWAASNKVHAIGIGVDDATPIANADQPIGLVSGGDWRVSDITIALTNPTSIKPWLIPYFGTSNPVTVTWDNCIVEVIEE